MCPSAGHIYIASVLTNGACLLSLHAYFRSSPVSNLPQAFLRTSKAMSAITICSTLPPFCFTCTRARLSAAASQLSYIQKDHTKPTQVRVSTSSLEGACYMTLHLAYHISIVFEAAAKCLRHSCGDASKNCSLSAVHKADIRCNCFWHDAAMQV